MTFQTAYDVLLGRWGVPVEQLDLAGTHVNACGPVGAPPVVLLAGHGATSAVWFSVASQLAQDHRVYALDVPGDAGRSTAPPPRSVDDLVTWLSGVLADLDHPMLVGHSYGGWIALTYALQNPASLSRLALIDPTECFAGLKPTYVARALPMLLRPTEARYRSFLAWETQGLPVDPDWITLAALGTLEPTAKVVRPRRPSATAIERLPLPLLVTVADRSKAHDPEQIAGKAEAAGASVVRMATATHHSLPAAHGNELSEALLKFSGEG
jgi:pimeloyl-ACP methyl ester carboxylesterase